MDDMEIGWLAGLFEGEGSIVMPTKQNGAVLTVFMTDLDVLEHIQTVTNAGTVRGPYSDSKGRERKPMYKWNTSKTRDVARLLLAMYPLLGERRQARVGLAVERLLLVSRGSVHCKRGHRQWAVDYKGRRFCRTCWNEAQRRRRSSEKEIA